MLFLFSRVQHISDFCAPVEKSSMPGVNTWPQYKDETKLKDGSWVKAWQSKPSSPWNLLRWMSGNALQKHILWILTALSSIPSGQDKIEKHNDLPWRFDRDIKNRLCQLLCEINQLGQESQMKLPDSMTDLKCCFKLGLGCQGVYTVLSFVSTISQILHRNHILVHFKWGNKSTIGI